MAETSEENVAKSGENPKENGVKMRESHKGSPVVNGKHNGDTVKNGSGEENPKLIISQKSTPTHSHKSLHTPQAASCTTASPNINHVAPKSDSKSKSEVKSSSETPSKDKKRRDEHGKNGSMAIYSRKISTKSQTA